MEFDPKRSSLWISSTPPAPVAHPALDRDVRVDAAVIGAGVTGITAAYLLKKAGKTVALLERGRAALAETGHTTAHLTHVLDTRLTHLVRTFGEGNAKAAWDSSEVAIRQIETLVRREDIRCDFRRVPGYLFAPDDKDVPLLEEEQRWATRFGYQATRTDPGSFPFRSRLALRFEGQARFQPRRYLLALLEKVPGDGSFVFENTGVKSVEHDGGQRVVTDNGRTVRCGHVVVAAHVPFNNRYAIHVKQAAYRSYVIAARMPKGQLPDALYWDTLDPYHYVRLQPNGDHDLVILGGEDHKTGQVTDTDAAYRRLIDYLRDQLGPEATLVGHWSGQIMETIDGLPYIGANVDAPETELVATGYAGNGMTYGTLAGMMLSDRVLGRETPWDRLYNPSRIKARGLRDFIAENVDFPLHLVKDWLSGADARSPEDVRPGEGKIVRVGGKKVAVYREDNGELHGCSPVCPHMGCQVHWNNTERTWDCPCHGSRFLPTGEVLNGPAVSGLERVPLAEPAHA